MPFNLLRDLMVLERIVCCICIYSKKYNKKKKFEKNWIFSRKTL